MTNMSFMIALVLMAAIGGFNPAISAEKWGAVAAVNTGAKIATAVVSNLPTQAAAEAAAVAACSRKGAGACTVRTVFNSGCVYVTTGKGPAGTTGFALAWGNTAEFVTAECFRQGAVTCESPEGKCAAP